MENKNVKLTLETEFSKVEVMLKNYPTTVSELVDAFYGAMVTVGYSGEGVAEDMVEFGNEKLNKNDDRTIQD